MISTISDNPVLPRRPADGHKGTFGTVCVVGGSTAGPQRMLGAPALAALGALRAGCGLVKIAAPAPIVSQVVSLAPSATGIALDVNESGEIEGHLAAALIDKQAALSECLVVGPGLGNCAGVRALVLRAVQKDDTPLVLDADGLNAMSEIVEIQRDFRAPAIVTPHPGEYARLAKSLALSSKPADPESRCAAAAELAQRIGCIVVLKGAGTVVSDGLRVWTCNRGAACLATAGTGDVLSGVIGGLVAQFFARRQMSLFDAARAGVLVHAIAGEQWAANASASGGMLAGDLLPLIPGICESVRGDGRAAG